METVNRHVPTQQDLESVAAGLDTDWLVIAEHVQVSFNCTTCFAGSSTTYQSW